MIYFMLNDLRGKTREGLDPRLHISSLIAYLDLFIPLDRARITKQRKTALRGIIRLRFFDYLGIEHHDILTAIVKNDDPL